MPLRMKTRCRYPGCPRTGRERFCEEHRHVSFDRPSESRRETAAERGYDNNWRKLRAWYFAHHPLCEDCLEQGITNATNIEVDHVVPISVRPDLRLNGDNLRSRCKRHHKLKTDRDKVKYAM